MMDKNEVIDCFDMLEHDIMILQQMLAMRNDVLDSLNSGDKDRQNEIQSELDKLEDQLQIIEIF